MSDSVLLRIIDTKIRELGISEYTLEPYVVTVDKPEVSLVFKNDVLFLVNDQIDLPVTAQLQLKSPHYVFHTSVTDFKYSRFSKYRAFPDKLNIMVKNYGPTFPVFKLEFLKVIPIIKTI